MDSLYYQQKRDLKKCTDDFSYFEAEVSKFYSGRWLEKVCDILKDELSNEDKVRFESRRYKRCYLNLAKYVSNKHLCEDFENKYKNYDLIYGFEVLDFEECVRSINDGYLTGLVLHVPRVDMEELAAMYGVSLSRRGNLDTLGFENL
ncbi:hypothetical protein BDAP_001709 [Binucleata daphniae]